MHVTHRDAEFFGEEITEAGAIKHASHADHFVLRQSGGFLQSPHHRIERIGDADHEGVGGILLQACANLFHDLQIDAQKIVAAHAGLARHTGRHNHDIGTGNRFIGIGTGIMGVKPVNGG